MIIGCKYFVYTGCNVVSSGPSICDCVLITDTVLFCVDDSFAVRFEHSHTVLHSVFVIISIFPGNGLVSVSWKNYIDISECYTGTKSFATD